MASGLVLAVAQTLLMALESTELRDICAMFGYKSRLKELQDSVTTIKAVLLDAEAKEEQLSNDARLWVVRLKHAVYDADDLFDEFITLTRQESQMVGGKLIKKVRRFLSDKNQLLVAFNMSQDIKRIRKKLDSIASDHSKFGLDVVFSKPRTKREETCSYVFEHSIVGRDSDKEEIVNMLLRKHLDRAVDVSFLTIVGIGGLGKTTLAQLVYNDDRIVSAFQPRLWVCVSEEFGMKEILGKMLSLPTKQRLDRLGMEELHREVREQIQGKLYLLVLDDVWNENRHEWIKLREFLALGARGSRVLVTTRSKKVATVVGEDQIYELTGLSRESSWLLFKKFAFKKGQEEEEPDLVEIGKHIVEKCANIPLAIRVIGSMLYGQHRSKWLLFKYNLLAGLGQHEDFIMPTLKLSYHNLPSALKSCFSYCALFPKDYVIEKDMLIRLWIAHGFIIPLCKGNSIEEAAEEYFTILLQRCFFQDIEEDEYGDIFSCKMHDLMHDLAREVAGSEYLVFPSSISSLDKNVRHLFFSNSYISSPIPRDILINWKMLRTISWTSIIDASVCTLNQAGKLLNHCRKLRVLDFRISSMKTVPCSLPKLLHLRYLDLSFTQLEMLPNSITELYNLQVLKLCDCYNLRGLPSNLNKLASLRHLDIMGCYSLTHMPPGMDKLTCLHTLTRFVVGEGNPKYPPIGQLKDLKSLINLKGDLTIELRKCFAYDAPDGGERTKVLCNANLRSLTIYFMKGADDSQEKLLEDLQPNYGLRGIEILGYGGVRIPSWVSLRNGKLTPVPYLVKIRLLGLPRLKYLPSLSRLAHLKYLELENIPNVEYLDDKQSITASTSFFPSLEELRLEELPMLKGWWRDSLWVDKEASGGIDDHSGSSEEYQYSALPSFPRLHKLTIRYCVNLTSFPACPYLKELELYEAKKKLTLGWSKMRSVTPASTNSSSCDVSDDMNNWCSFRRLGSLELLELDNVEYLNWFAEDFISTGGNGEGFQTCFPSLRHLFICNCCEVKSLSGVGLEYLTNLQHLTIDDAPNLAFEEEEYRMMPWRSLQSLSILELKKLPKMVYLPHGLQYLTALQSLHISECHNLRALPEWLCGLSSLRVLEIWGCSGLKSLPEAMHRVTSLKLLDLRACHGLTQIYKQPSEEESPKIWDIPNVIVKENMW